MRAAGFGREDIIEDLLKAGADPSLKDRNGHTCVDFATMVGHMKVLKYFGVDDYKQENEYLGD